MYGMYRDMIIPQTWEKLLNIKTEVKKAFSVASKVIRLSGRYI